MKRSTNDNEEEEDDECSLHDVKPSTSDVLSEKNDESGEKDENYEEDEDSSSIEIDSSEKDIVCYEKWDIHMLSLIKASKLLKHTRNMVEKIDINYLRLDPSSVEVHYSTRKGDVNGMVYGCMVRKSIRITKPHPSTIESDENTTTTTTTSSSTTTTTMELPKQSSTNDMEWIICGKSLCHLDRWIRRLVSHQYYEDYDIVNCAPSLISQILHKYDLETPKLDDYILRRKEIYSKYTSRYPESFIKMTFLKALHLGWPSSVFTEAVALREELASKFRALRFKTPEFEELYKNSNMDKGNPLGSFASHVWQREEFKIMKLLRKYFVNLGFPKERMVLCFDGIMVEKNEILQLSVSLSDMSSLVYDKTGFTLVIVNKTLLPTVEDFNILKFGQTKTKTRK